MPDPHGVIWFGESPCFHHEIRISGFAVASSDAPPPAPRKRRWLLVVIIAVAVLLLGAGAYGITVLRSQQERSEALAAAKDKQFDRAIEGLKRSYDRNPADIEVIEALARGYQQADDLEAAVWLDRWVNAKPNDADALRTRVDFYRRRKDDVRVMTDIRRMLELDPNNFQLRRTAMGQAFSYGHFAEAEQYCRECLQKQSGDRFLRTILAETRRAQGDATEAARILDELIREDGRATGPLLARANIHIEQQELDKAVPLLRTVFQNDRQQRRAAGYQLSMALERSGKTDEAQKVLSEVRRLQDVEVFGDAIKNQPDNPALLTRLGESLLRDGHHDDGLKIMERALAIDPFYAPAHRALAAHFEAVGQPARAAEHRRMAGTSP